MRGVFAEKPDEPRHDIHGQEVHRVHQQDPQPDGHRERRHELVAVAVEYSLDLVVDELEAKLDERLPLRRHATRGAARDPPEETETQYTQDYRDDHGIHVDRHEGRIAHWLRIEREVVRDVLGGALIRSGHLGLSTRPRWSGVCLVRHPTRRWPRRRLTP